MGGLCGGTKKGTNPKVNAPKNLAKKGKNAQPGPPDQIAPPMQLESSKSADEAAKNRAAIEKKNKEAKAKADKESKAKKAKEEKEKAEREAEAKRILEEERKQREEAERKAAEEMAKRVAEYQKTIKDLMGLQMRQISQDKNEQVRQDQLKATNDMKRTLALEHGIELAVKLQDNYTFLKRQSRALVIAVLNTTNSPIQMAHAQMATGVHKYSTNKTIAPQTYEHFTFHNSFLTGLSGELFFNHKQALWRVGFSNPLVGVCKGLVEERQADAPFDYMEGTALKRANDNKAQETQHVITKYLPNIYPPIYTIVFRDLD